MVNTISFLRSRLAALLLPLCTHSRMSFGLSIRFTCHSQSFSVGLRCIRTRCAILEAEVHEPAQTFESAKPVQGAATLISVTLLWTASIQALTFFVLAMMAMLWQFR